MRNLASVLEKLVSTIEFTPEYEGPDVFAAIKEPYESLLKEYPRLKDYSAYLEFLRLTGGAHLHNRDFSLVIYGFGGYVVPSFAEGLFVDQERYFLFGEVLYTSQPDPIYFFGFDLSSDQDVVYISPDEESHYTLCEPSFFDLLLDFANGKYPSQKN